MCGAGEPHERWILQCSRENDHTHHSNAAKLTSSPTTFLYFFHSAHVTPSFLPCIRHPLFFHFPSSHWSVQLYWPTLPQSTRARDCDTHFHASMINTEGCLFIMLISILQWPSHYTRTHSSFKHSNTVRWSSCLQKWINCPRVHYYYKWPCKICNELISLLQNMWSIHKHDSNLICFFRSCLWLHSILKLYRETSTRGQTQ